jgi:glucokinase
MIVVAGSANIDLVAQVAHHPAAGETLIAQESTSNEVAAMFSKPRVGLAGDPDSPWRLVADIGGTHARFALVDEYGALQAQETLRCAAFAGPAEAVRHYLSSHQAGSVRAAAVAVATAVYKDRIAFTNRASWAFSQRGLGAQLGIENFRVLNDFTALALAIPRLDHEWLLPVIPDVHGDPEAPRAVLGPGTGLGVSGVLRVAGRWHALDS